MSNRKPGSFPLKEAREFIGELLDIFYPNDDPDHEWGGDELDLLGGLFEKYGLIREGENE